MIYFIKVNVGIAIFYAFYKLFFYKDTFFVWRRVALLSFLTISLIYPLLNLQGWTKAQEPMQYIADTYLAYLPEVLVLPAGAEVATATTTSLIPEILLGLYVAVIVLLVIRLFIQLAAIVKLVARSAGSQQMGISFRILPTPQGPFSFFKWIFIHPSSCSQAQLEEVLTHESTHAAQWHSLDILFFELASIVFWFNPFVWLMRREVRNNLEFLADQHVLEKGFDSRTYQYHLLGLAYPHRKEVATLYNNFNVLPLKKRIKMMNKKRTKQIGRAKYMMFVPLVALLLVISNIEAIARETKTIFSTEQAGTFRYTGRVVNGEGEAIVGARVGLSGADSEEVTTDSKGVFVINSPQKGEGLWAIHSSYGSVIPIEKYTEGMVIQLKENVKSKRDSSIYDVVEAMPQFPAGFEGLMEYLRANVQYPKEAHEKQIHGRVIVTFVVDKEGNATRPQIVRGIDPLLDEEALRVVCNMPKWIPGRQNGEVVSVSYTLPITFSLGK